VLKQSKRYVQEAVSPESCMSSCLESESNVAEHHLDSDYTGRPTCDIGIAHDRFSSTCSCKSRNIHELMSMNKKSNNQQTNGLAGYCGSVHKSPARLQSIVRTPIKPEQLPKQIKCLHHGTQTSRARARGRQRKSKSNPHQGIGEQQCEKDVA
jgi:hypothetical protein